MPQFWDPGEVSDGFNVISVLPGREHGTPRDRLVVVGAHWDTTGFTDGYNDNGWGVKQIL